MKESIALVVYPGCILFELSLALEFLEKTFRVEAFSPKGGNVPTSFGISVATKPFSEGLPEGCRAVLVPGGEFSSIREDDSLDSFLQEANRRGCVLAAICGGVFALGKAGLLKGRKFVHPFDSTQMEFLDKYFLGGIPQDKEFLHDGNLLTAQPFAFIDFAVELAARLGAIPRERIIFFKNYYRGYPRGRIRPLALALVRRPNGQFLVHEGIDAVKREIFYRPLGGGIEFGEKAATALAREFAEEIGEEIEVGSELGSIENLFTYEGREGHEIHVVFEAKFKNAEAYEKTHFEIDESGISSGRAVWMSLDEITEGRYR